MEGYLDAKGVAKMLGITVSAVHRLAARGTLPGTWLGGIRFWKRETVQRYLDDDVAQARRRGAAILRKGQQLLELGEAIDDMRSRSVKPS